MTRAQPAPTPAGKVRVNPVPNTERVTFGSAEPSPELPPWSDRPLYIVAGGPSLRGYDLSGLRARGRVLGVNRAADLVPCDATTSIDVHFVEKYKAQLVAWAAAGQEVWLAVPSDYQRAPLPGARYLERVRGEGCSLDPRAVVNGLNSGYSAVNLAVLRGARTIYLLGYDMLDLGQGIAHHWHDGYKWQGARGTARCYTDWARRFDDLARGIPAGVAVWNCNPESAVRAFPFSTYEAVGLVKRA